MEKTLFVATLILLLPVLALAQTQTIDITQSPDDAQGTVFAFDDNDEYYFIANSQVAGNVQGLRFLSLNIAQGYTVDSASLELGTWAACGGGTCKLKINGIDEDDCDSLTSSNKPNARDTTDAVITYEVGSSDIANGYYVIRKFVVTGHVQEIVNRVAFASGNAVGFVIRDNGSTPSFPGKNLKMWTYDNTSSVPIPTLKVWWTTEEGLPACQVIVINQ